MLKAEDVAQINQLLAEQDLLARMYRALLRSSRPGAEKMRTSDKFTGVPAEILIYVHDAAPTESGREATGMRFPAPHRQNASVRAALLNVTEALLHAVDTSLKNLTVEPPPWFRDTDCPVCGQEGDMTGSECLWCGHQRVKGTGA